MRSIQRPAALRRLFQARPAVHSALPQTRAPLQQSFRTRPSQPLNSRFPSALRSIHTQRQSNSSSPFILRAIRRTRRPNGNSSSRRHNSSSATPEAEPTSIKERLKKMSREYGWTAVGVYFALSALDFPFCFLAVRLIGTDTIGHYEHVVVESVKGILKWPIQGTQVAEMVADVAVEEGAGGKEVEEVGRQQKRILDEKSEQEVFDHGYREAERANRGDNASLWTQLALAYAVHKSFIFIRVPLTAAILPKVVKTLRGWGYNIGKMPARKAVTSGTGTGVNTKGSGVKPRD